MNMPPPQWPPPLTDCTLWPSISTHEFSYPYQRHVDEAPIGSITSSRSTSGSGRRHTCRAASAIAFTRTSLYLKCVPGSYRLRLAPLGDDVAVARDDAARGSTILDRSDDRVERFFPKAVAKEQVHIVRAGRVCRNRRLHRFVDQRGVHRDFVRPLVLPVESLGEVRRA